MILTQANAISIPLQDNSVHAVITSPPYWSLRDYKLEPSIWPSVTYTPMPGLEPVTVPAYSCCLGLEPTPELFTAHLVLVFREAKRILRDDGVCWLNLGDSFSQGGGAQVLQTKNASHGLEGMRAQTPWIASKQLCFIPERVALALQADGWWVRSKPPWLKKNSMPESVRDRPTTAHENWYQLSKSATYYYDQDAVLQPHRMKPQRRLAQRQSRRDEAMRADKKYLYKLRDEPGIEGNPAGRQRRTTDFWDESLDEFIKWYQNTAIEYLSHLEHVRDNGGMLLSEDGQPLGLMYSTKPYKGSHFATFSPDLITPLIHSSISERGCCPGCGTAWRRVVDKISVPRLPGKSSEGQIDNRPAKGSLPAALRTDPSKSGFGTPTVSTTGWHPGCRCGYYPPPERGPVPCPRCKGTGREREYSGSSLETAQQSSTIAKLEIGQAHNVRDHSGDLRNNPPVETGAPCKNCHGTGTVTGDVWPDDVDEWEVAPSVVVDPFAGTATVGEALRSLQVGGCYPATFVGVDLKHAYLADLARERLGLKALAARDQPLPGGGDEALDALPLFAHSNQVR